VTLIVEARQMAHPTATMQAETRRVRPMTALLEFCCQHSGNSGFSENFRDAPDVNNRRSSVQLLVKCVTVSSFVEDCPRPGSTPCAHAFTTLNSSCMLAFGRHWPHCSSTSSAPPPGRGAT